MYILFTRLDGSEFNLNVNSIVYFESSLDGALIGTEFREFTVKETCQEVDAKINAANTWLSAKRQEFVALKGEDSVLRNPTEKEKAERVKRHAKQGETVVIIGDLSRHGLDIGREMIVAFDAEENGQVVASGFFVGYDDYLVLDVPVAEVTISEYVEEVEEKTVVPTKLIKRPAKGGETIEITGNTGRHGIAIGAQIEAMGDAGNDKSVIAFGHFVPYEDYSVVIPI